MGNRFGIIPTASNNGQLYIKQKRAAIHWTVKTGFYIFSPEELAVKTDFKIIITDLFINTIPVLPGNGSLLQKQVEEITI
jgi:hypothetical protein